MAHLPIFGVHSECKNALERADWLQEIFESAGDFVSNNPEFQGDAWYWQGSIERVDYGPDIVTVYWSESIALSRFKSAFAVAWDELGDDTPVEHTARDEFSDGDRVFPRLID